MAPKPTIDYAGPNARPEAVGKTWAVASLACAGATVAAGFAIETLSDVLGNWVFWIVPLLLIAGLVLGRVAAGDAKWAEQESGVERPRVVRMAVVVAIALPILLASLAVLLVLLAPPRVHLPINVCRSNLRQIGSALGLYSIEQHTVLPPTLDPLLAADIFNGNTTIFACPDAAFAPGPPPLVYGTNLSYRYVGGGIDLADGRTAVVAVCDAPHAGGEVVVLFADGHVETMSPAALAALPNTPTTRPVWHQAAQPSGPPTSRRAAGGE